MPVTAATAADKQRWRAFLGLDPDAAPSVADLDHIDRLSRDVLAGKRPDLAPPGLELSSAQDDAAAPSADTDADAAHVASMLSEMTVSSENKAHPILSSVATTQDGPRTTINTAVGSDPEIQRIHAELVSSGSRLSNEEFEKVVLQGRQTRETEMATKQGRARWESLEDGKWGHAAPGTWKKAKERVAEQNAAQKPDWSQVRSAIDLYKERVRKGEVKPAEAKAGKGKKGKR